MQLLSIENLSLAAEVTAVLLLLTFAWPKKNVKPQTPELEVQEASSWEPTKQFYLQSCLHRGLYLQLCRQRQDPFVPTSTVDEAGRPNVPLPWQDRLTGLLNRNGFDAVLNAWLAVESKHRGGACLSMVTLGEYSDLVSVHGAMVTEQAIQGIANELVVALSSESLISKYLPDRFVVLHFSSGIEACFTAMENLQRSIADPGFFNINGQSRSLATLVTIADLEGDSSLTTRIDELEEGAMDAETRGQHILAKVDGTWSDSPVAKESEHLAETLAKELELTHENQPLVIEAIPTKSKPYSLSNNPDNIKTSKDFETGIDDAAEVNTSHDISAVANADDIAALFEQINANKSNKSNKQTEAEQDSSQTVAAPSKQVEVDVTEPATADDIASLFETVKSSVSHAVSPAPSPMPAPSIASKEDIEAIIAAKK